MRFREYVLQKRRITDTPAGDFTADARSDDRVRGFPDASTWEEVDNYLWRRGASAEARAAGREVWRQYERYVRKHKPISIRKK